MKRKFNVRPVCKDITRLADSINRLWKRQHRDITLGVARDAQHFSTDVEAIHRVITWVINHPWTCGRKCQAAASRLHAVLQHITPTQQAELQRALWFAELCVVRTLRLNEDGHWIRGPIKEMYA